ncbi:hypothetical protein TKK_0016910 [Trichogramma kaykai]
MKEKTIQTTTGRNVDTGPLASSETRFQHYPDWDAVRGEPILDLMRVGRELLKVDADLEAKRLEYDHRRHLFDQQWKDLRRKEIALKKSFVKFDEFVRENREKRERADRKIREEKERQKIRETEIRDCVWNLYNQMCYRKGVSAEAKRDDLEEQLQMVKRTIVELGKIVKMAKRRARRELKAIQKSEYQKKVKKVIRAKSYMSRMSALSTVSRSRTKSMRSIASTWDTRSMISTI